MEDQLIFCFEDGVGQFCGGVVCPCVLRVYFFVGVSAMCPSSPYFLSLVEGAGIPLASFTLIGLSDYRVEVWNMLACRKLVVLLILASADGAIVLIMLHNGSSLG